MPDSRRYFIYIFYILFLVLLAVLGFMFRAFLMENFVRPVALVFWFILRLFLAVDQKIYWILLLLFAFFEAVRHIPQTAGVYDTYPEVASQSALEHVKNWRAFISLTASSSALDQHNLLRQNLVNLVVETYATDREDGEAAYNIHDALKHRRIPLPDPVYHFLFPEAPVPVKTLAGVWRRIWQTPRQWIRRWRGQDVAEYYQSIDSVLAFMETTLEIPHDNQHNEERNH